MYDPQLTNPIDAAVMNSFAQIITDFSDRESLFLSTSFYEAIGKFCLCHDGKCKYKVNVPLESAVKTAGHEGVSV